eukprot:scaffold428410_cov34-Prasinocladus_malaysianus.AAC.1
MDLNVTSGTSTVLMRTVKARGSRMRLRQLRSKIGGPFLSDGKLKSVRRLSYFGTWNGQKSSHASCC